MIYLSIYLYIYIEFDKTFGSSFVGEKQRLFMEINILLIIIIFLIGLVNENTALKTELSELRGERERERERERCHLFSVGHFVTVQTQYKESLQTLQDQTSLITQLESDLTRIQPYLPPRTEGEVIDNILIINYNC